MATRHLLLPFGLTTLAFVVAFISLVYLLHRRATHDRIAPAGLSWAGLRNEPCAKIRAHFRDAFAAPAALKEGYDKYSTKGKAFICPNITFRPIIVLAPSQFRWHSQQPDNVLSITEALKDAMQLHYTSPRSWAFERPFHMEALNKMPLDRMTPDIFDEIIACIDQLWGANTESWRQVRVSTLNVAIIRITNRVFVGAELCKNETLIKNVTKFVNGMAMSGVIINLIPKVLHPLLGPIVALPCRYYDWRSSRYIVPIVAQHLRAYADAEKTAIPTRDKPQDMLQIFSRYAVRSAPPVDRNARSICSRLLALNFAAVHSTTMTMINAIIDVMSLGVPYGCFDSIRAEAVAVLRTHDGVWSKAAVNQLVKSDSMFREVLRFRPNKFLGVGRHVAAKGGATLPDGTHLPQHTLVDLPTYGVHFDERFYDDPMTFNPWRFVGNEKPTMVAVSETFLGLGFGRHACPGRFYAAVAMKLMLAYIALNYDIQPLAKRTPNSQFSDYSVPPDVELIVRRRKYSAHLDDT